MAAGSIKKIWLFLALFISAACVVVGVYFATLYVTSKIGGSLEEFTEEKINATFGEYITATKASGSGNLEVATHETLAVFSETKEKSYVWGTIPGGVTSVEIKAPVTYRYHIRLDDPWRIEINGPVCTVYAPAIRASQPPAIHTDKMQKRIDESWISFDGRQMMSELERKMTPQLMRRAKANIHLVREPSRKVVATFIKNWLLQEKQWHDRFHSVVVIFEGEERESGESMEIRNDNEVSKPGITNEASQK